MKQCMVVINLPSWLRSFRAWFYSAAGGLVGVEAVGFALVLKMCYLGRDNLPSHALALFATKHFQNFCAFITDC